MPLHPSTQPNLGGRTPFGTPVTPSHPAATRRPRGAASNQPAGKGDLRPQIAVVTATDSPEVYLFETIDQARQFKRSRLQPDAWEVSTEPVLGRSFLEQLGARAYCDPVSA
jgi:hypothetical protein